VSDTQTELLTDWPV